MDADGIRLALAHRAALKGLIVSDPRTAIEQAVPMVLRQRLPAAIVAQLERRVSGSGPLETLAVSPDSAPEEPTVRRFVTIDGEEYRARLYGRRSGLKTTPKIMVNGVAVDRELAVSEEPARLLEIGEVPDAAKDAVRACPVSGKSTAVTPTAEGSLPPITPATPAVEAGKQIIYLCDGGHFRQIVEEIIAGEATANEGATGGPAPTSIGFPLTNTTSTGVRRMLYMRVIFPDRKSEPQSEAGAYANIKTLTDYFQEQSYGRLTFLGTVAPLLTLPRSEAWYITDYNTTGSNTPIMNDAKEAARAAGFPPEDYQHFVLIYFGGPGSFGGLGNVGGIPANVWLKTTAIGTFEHEIGHNVGVWHSNAWNTGGASTIGPGANLEYGHTKDVMGTSSSGGHFNASMKEQLQWIRPENYHTVLQSGTYRLFQFDQASQDPARRYSLKVAKDADRDYWLEFRQKFSTNPWWTSGASINWSPWGVGSGVDTATAQGSNLGPQVLDMTPGTPDGLEDGPVVIGRTFSDAEAGIHITPIGKAGTTPESLDVVVNAGAFAGNQAPTLTIEADNTTIAAGGTVNFTATANDPEGDALAYYWEFGDKLASFNGFSFSTDNAAVQSKTYASAGYYTVRCTASDMRGGSVVKTLLITVGSPTTFTVSGIVIDSGGAPVRDVRVSNGLSGSSMRWAFTDSDGFYTITNLAAGSVTLSGLKAGYSFTAGFANPLALGPSQTGANFTAAATPTVSIAAIDPIAIESGDTGTFRITRTGDTSVALTVYTDFSGSGSSGTDYTLSPAAVTTPSPLEVFTIPAGSATLDITLTPVNDASQEGVETVNMSLVNGGSYLPIGSQTATVSIDDDDTTRPRVSIYATVPETTEGSGTPGRFTVSRTGSVDSLLSVTFSVDTSAGNATNGTDYASILSAVTIPAGAAETTINISTIDDAIVEGMELVKVTLFSGTFYLTNTASTATVKINDDDINVVTLTATDSSANENGDAGTFTFTRTGDASAALMVNYAIGGSAMHGVDYQALPGYITFAAGSATATVDILPIDDSHGEPAQTVILQLRSGTTYQVGGNGNASVTLNDDGDLPVVAVAATSAQAQEGGSSGTFLFTTTGTGTGNITVRYTLSGTATSGSDFTALSGVLSMGKNTTASIGVSIINDAVLEDAESITLTITLDPTYTADLQNSATITIRDNDLANMVSVSTTSTAVSETLAGRFYFSRSGSTTNAITVNYGISGTATAGDDYTALTGTVVIAAASSGTYVDVTTVNDTAIEGTETVVVTVLPETPAPTNYGIESGIATMSIADNDAGFASNVGFAVASVVQQEGAGGFTIDVTRTGATSGAASVEFGAYGGTALGSGVDYICAAGRLDFAAGETVKTIPITIVDDNIAEDVETVTLQLRNANGAAITSAAAQFTALVLDNEPRVTISASDPFAYETGDTAQFTIRRHGTTAGALVVPIAVSGTAASGSDFTALPASVTIPNGAAAATLTLTPLSDGETEVVETVIVSLAASSDSQVGAQASATAFIGDAQGNNAPFIQIVSPKTSAPAIPGGVGLAIDASVVDESAVTTTWSKVSGPGVVTFSAPSQPDTDAIFSANGAYVLRLTAGDGTLTTTSDLSVAVGAAIVPWTSTDIGTVGLPGSATEQNGIFAANGAGTSLGGTADSFFLHSRRLVGDGEIRARVRYVPHIASSRVGVMLRESTAVGSTRAAMTIGSAIGNFSAFHYRTTTDGTGTAPITSGINPPWWLRVVRSGNSFSGYDSPDGVTWTQRGTTQSISMAGDILAGLAVYSGLSTKLTTALVDSVQIIGTPENTAPGIGAGADGNALTSTAYALDATLNDDALPALPGATTVQWTQRSGPGAASFANDAVLDTTATFPVAGTYVLRLTADDGEVQTFGEASIAVASNTAPTVAVAPTGTSTNVSPIDFTLTFSQPVTGLTVSGIAVTNGTKGTLSGSGTTYTIPVTPSGQGAVTCQVIVGAAVNATSEGNLASNLASVLFDNVAPTVVVTPTGTTTGFSPIVFTLTFSSPVSGLTDSAITVSNGTKGALSGSGSTYTMPVTPSGDGAVTCQVDAGAAQDAVGNGSAASSVASVIYDTMSPTVSVTPTGITTNASPITFSLSFSVPVAGLTAGEITVTNGTKGALSGSGGAYSLPVTPLSPGAVVTCQVTAGAAQDSSSRNNLASNMASVTYDPAAGGTGWEVSFQSAHVFGIDMAKDDPNVGWAVGENGLMRKTTDGGATWTFSTLATGGNHFNGVHALNTTTAWIVGQNGVVERTTNGTNWSYVSLSGFPVLNSVAAADASTVWVVGASGTISKSTNGGASFTAQTSGVSVTLQDVAVVDANTAWVVGASGTILKTVNGGATWTAQTSGTTQTVQAIVALDANTAFAVGGLGTILKTTTGGATWTALTSGTTSFLYNIAAVSSSTLWVTGVSGLIRKTSDGGATWSAQTSSNQAKTSLGTATPGNLTALWAKDVNTALVGGFGGGIEKTTDGGTTWEMLVPSLSFSGLNAVASGDVNTAWAFGNNGQAWKSTDGATSWTQYNPGTGGGIIYGASALGSSTAWIVGAAGSIRKTTDGGTTWAGQTSGTTQTLYTISAVDTNTAWVVGATGTILKTTNGGATWSPQTSGTTQILYTVVALDANTAWAGGNSGTLLKTIDGGATWSALSIGNTDLCHSIAIVGSTVWVGQSSSVLRKSTDGGATWVSQSPGGSGLPIVIAINANTAWSLSYASVRKTIDGGTTWLNEPVPLGVWPAISGNNACKLDSTRLLFANTSNSTVLRNFAATPRATTLAADRVTTTTARINGLVDPSSSGNTAALQWGTTTSYGNDVPFTYASGNAEAQFARANLSGLSPHTTYHFRATASSDLGVTNGADATFTTANNVPVATLTSAGTAEDTPVAITLTGTDADGDALTYAITQQPPGSAGTVGSVSGSSATFTPALNFNGVATFQYTASDAFGGTSVPQTVTITVTPVGDPPTLNLPASPLLAEATSTAGAVVSFSVTAVDPEDGALTPFVDPASGSAFPFGDTTVNVSATDSESNTTSGSFVVRVRDTTPPALSLPASPLTVATIDPGAVVNFSVSATDVVDGACAAMAIPASGSTFPLGDTTVNVTASDTRGNVANGSFIVRVVPLDYVVSTTGGTLTIIDRTGNSDTLAISEPGAGSIRFAASARSFSVDGAAALIGNSGTIPLNGISSIVVSAGAGNDTVTLTAFSGTSFPGLTINGGTGNDVVQFNGNITFAADASLDLDLQNDDAVPGLDSITIGSTAATARTELKLGGTGAAALRCSGLLQITGPATGTQPALLQTADGAIVMEANMQAAASNLGTGTTTALAVNGLSKVEALGAGTITMKARGGIGATSNQSGMAISQGAQVVTNTGQVSIEATGGRPAGGVSANIGFTLTGTPVLSTSAAVKSSSGDILITGFGGSGRTAGSIAGAGSFGTSFGVALASTSGAAEISTTGGGSVTIVGDCRGSGNTGSSAGMSCNFGKVATVDGDITIMTFAPDDGSVTGTASNRGLNMPGGSTIQCTGTGNISIIGTGGPGSAGSNHGVRIAGTNTVANLISSNTGTIAITGIAHANGGSPGAGGSGTAATNAIDITPMSTGNSTISTQGGAIIFTGDSLGIAKSSTGTPSVTSGAGGSVTFKPNTAGKPIVLGGIDSASALGLTDTELDFVVSTGTIVIGDATSGAITQSGVISRNAGAPSTVELDSGGLITLSQAGGATGSIITLGGNVRLDPGGAYVASATGVDANLESSPAGNPGTLSLASGDALDIAINGTTADGEAAGSYRQLRVIGKVDLTGASLNFSGTHAPAAGQNFTIIDNDGASDGIVGNFAGLAEGATIVGFLGSGLNAKITYAGGDGNDVVIRVNAPPVLTLPGSPVLAEAISPAGAAVAFTVAADDAEDGALTPGATPASGSLFALGDTMVNVSVTDSASATASGSFLVRVQDTTAPSLTLPANMTVEATSAAGAVVTFTPSAADVVGVAMLNASPASGTIFPLGTTTVTVTATDAANNSSSGTFTVTVQDTTAPALSVPANMTVEATSAAGAVATFAPSATDAVGVAVLTASPTSGSTFPLGTTTVSVSASDAANNTSSGTFSVTVRDTTAPSVNAPPEGFAPLSIPTGLGGTAPLPDYAAQASAADAVGVTVALMQTPLPGSAQTVGTVHVVLSAQDAAGNVGTLAFDVTMTDGTAPVLVGPLGGFTPNDVPTGPMSTAALPDYTGQASATDNVAVVGAITQAPAPGSTHAVGTVNVTLSAQDADGNVGTLMFAVNVNDGTLPVIMTVPQDRTIAAGSTGTGVTPTLTGEVVATDNVGVTGITQNPAAGATLPLGPNDVTITVRDVAGNSAQAIVHVTVSDQSMPVVSAPEGGFTPTTIATGAGGDVALPDYAAQATATDNVGVVGPIVQMPAPGSAQVFGTVPVVLSAVDAAGNVGTLAFNVIVTDGTPPMLTLPADKVVEATSAAGATVSYPPATATDEVTANPTLSYAPESGSVFPLGTTTVMVAATDEAGNSTSGSFMVTVRDTTAPVVTPPPNVIAEATSAAGAGVNYPAATATDAVTAAPGIAYSQTSGTTFPIGTTTVSVTATDAANNAGTATFTVTVRDTTVPMIGGTFSPLMVMVGTLPDYIGQATTSDEVGIENIVQVPAPGLATSVGTTMVTLTATDAAGNQSSTSFDVVVRPLAPVTTELLRQGGSLPGAGTPDGPPADAVVTRFGVPAIDDDGHLAFLATWTSATAGKGSGLLAGDRCLAKVGDPVPGVNGATFKSFYDPVIDAGRVVCLATFAGVPKSSAAAVVSFEADGTLRIVARTGDVATADGATFKSFGSVSVAGTSVGFIAQLKASAASDTGLWVKDGSDSLKLMMREGQQLGGKTIKKLIAFKTGTGSPGQGRGWLRRSSDPSMLALAIFADMSQAVIDADAGAMTMFSQSGAVGAGGPDIAGLSFQRYSMPIVNARGDSAFLATLATGGSVTKANARGIFADFGGSLFTPVARTGDDAGATGAKFSLLKDPVLADDGGLAFPATIKGGTVKGAAATTLWWQPAGGPLRLFAQGGAQPPELPAGAQWKAFPSLAIAANRGPVFTATLVPGKGGVTKSNATGVWAADFTGALRLLFRTGEPGAIAPGKTLKSFSLLNALRGSEGVTRSFNGTAKVVWLATFDDKSQAIVTTELP